MRALVLALLLAGVVFAAPTESETPPPTASEQAEIPTPDEACPPGTLGDCLDRYMAQRLYEQQVQGPNAVLATALPILVLLGGATLGVTLARGGR